MLKQSPVKLPPVFSLILRLAVRVVSTLRTRNKPTVGGDDCIGFVAGDRRRNDLAKIVIRRLKALAMPTKAAECKILEGDKDGLAVLSWRDHARAPFRHYPFRDQAARATSVELFHDLARRGCAEFRDLRPI